MRRPLASLLETLLNRSESLGVGLVDANGLLVEACGFHDGKDANELAVHLPYANPAGFELFLEERWVEHIMVGVFFNLYVRWLPNYKHLVYCMTPTVGVSGGPVRYALKNTCEDIAELFDILDMPLRERLEQPRQFTNGRLFGQGVGGLIK